MICPNQKCGNNKAIAIINGTHCTKCFDFVGAKLAILEESAGIGRSIAKEEARRQRYLKRRKRAQINARR